MAILATGTAIFTPFSLWRWIFPSEQPMNSASTLNEPDRSVQTRVCDGSGSEDEDGQPDDPSSSGLGHTGSHSLDLGAEDDLEAEDGLAEDVDGCRCFCEV